MRSLNPTLGQNYEKIKPCCMREENLFDAHREEGHILIRVCRMCRARHVRMNAQPGRIFADLRGITTARRSATGRRQIRMSADGGGYGSTIQPLGGQRPRPDAEPSSAGIRYLDL